ncbi:UNKNOWN [Stylonychia lemnae]|uniref:Lebercilin domain-containing protein n=1 Tax=Stylonychia lemnae TaxID=5949 RepID=A0A078AI76_STYLE|nr:UNKNOWN [Stylonychia lemnae]|eukprot:CDW81965.1 UNKNOWN [Stylonychia lemnae]
MQLQNISRLRLSKKDVQDDFQNPINITIKEDDIHVHEEDLQTRTIEKSTIVNNNNNNNLVKQNHPLQNHPMYASNERLIQDDDLGILLNENIRLKSKVLLFVDKLERFINKTQYIKMQRRQDQLGLKNPKNEILVQKSKELDSIIHRTKELKKQVGQIKDYFQNDQNLYDRMIQGEDQVKSQTKSLYDLQLENQSLRKIYEDQLDVLDNTKQKKEKFHEKDRLKKEINELTQRIKEQKDRLQLKERNVQNMHENIIGYETRCRQMVEIVREHKIKLKDKESTRDPKDLKIQTEIVTEEDLERLVFEEERLELEKQKRLDRYQLKMKNHDLARVSLEDEIISIQQKIREKQQEFKLIEHRKREFNIAKSQNRHQSLFDVNNLKLYNPNNLPTNQIRSVQQSPMERNSHKFLPVRSSIENYQNQFKKLGVKRDNNLSPTLISPNNLGLGLNQQNISSSLAKPSIYFTSRGQQEHSQNQRYFNMNLLRNKNAKNNDFGKISNNANYVKKQQQISRSKVAQSNVNPRFNGINLSYDRQTSREYQKSEIGDVQKISLNLENLKIKYGGKDRKVQSDIVGSNNGNSINQSSFRKKVVVGNSPNRGKTNRTVLL